LLQQHNALHNKAIVDSKFRPQCRAQPTMSTC